MWPSGLDANAPEDGFGIGDKGIERCVRSEQEDGERASVHVEERYAGAFSGRERLEVLADRKQAHPDVWTVRVARISVKSCSLCNVDADS